MLASIRSWPQAGDQRPLRAVGAQVGPKAKITGISEDQLLGGTRLPGQMAVTGQQLRPKVAQGAVRRIGQPDSDVTVPRRERSEGIVQGEKLEAGGRNCKGQRNSKAHKLRQKLLVHKALVRSRVLRQDQGGSTQTLDLGRGRDKTPSLQVDHQPEVVEAGRGDKRRLGLIDRQPKAVKNSTQQAHPTGQESIALEQNQQVIQVDQTAEPTAH